MHILRLLARSAAILAVAIAVPVQATPNCHPVSASAIQRMWTHYGSQPGAVAISGGGGFQCLAVESTHQVVCRTKRAHPAHPSIVIRTVLEKKGKLFVQTEADTAANCDAFLRLMQEYNELTRATVGGQ